MKVSLITFFCLITTKVILAQSVLTYQAVELSSLTVKYQNSYYYFENKDIIIYYDFWAENGDDGFSIYNKTDSTIYIDYSKCHFIKGTNTYDYYTEDIHVEETQVSNYNTRYSGNSYGYSSINGNSKSVNSIGYSSGYGNSKTSGVVQTTKDLKKDKKIVEIPSKSKIFNSKFLVSKDIYFDQMFLINNTANGPKSIDFNPDNTPLKISSMICYSFNENANYNCITNKFYVSKITNAKPSDFKGKKVSKTTSDEFGKTKTTFDYEYQFRHYNFYYVVKLKHKAKCSV